MSSGRRKRTFGLRAFCAALVFLANEAPAATGSERIIFLYHSTGGIVCDFYELETERGLYLRDESSAGEGNSHPNAASRPPHGRACPCDRGAVDISAAVPETVRESA